MDDFVKVNRSMLTWEWYQDEHTKSLFLHCLLKANWRDEKWKGKLIKRGQFPTSYNSLHNDLGITVNEVRNAISHLKSTNEITIKSHGKYSVITVVNYNLYQTDNKHECKQNENSSHAINKLLTTLEEVKEVKNNNIKDIGAKKGHFVPPSVEEVKTYCAERNNKINAEQFVDFYSANGWVQGKGKPIKEWKACVRTWERSEAEKKGKPPSDKNKFNQFAQNSYDFETLEQDILSN